MLKYKMVVYYISFKILFLVQTLGMQQTFLQNGLLSINMYQIFGL